MEEGTSFEKIVVFGDAHVPNIDRKAWKLLLRFIDDFAPDRIIINGDFLDCAEISKFQRVPGLKTFHEEMDEAKLLLQELRQHHSGQIQWISGNHEFRLRSYIIRNAPYLYGLISIPELLMLDKLGIEYIETPQNASRFVDTFIKVGKLYVGHFDKVSQHSAYTAKALVERKGISLLQAHCHRMGMFCKRLTGGGQLIGIEGGCLCDLNPDYTSDVNWQTGFCVVYHKKTSGRFHVYPIQMVNYAFMFGNKLYDEE
jgi:hypothetical protein